MCGIYGWELSGAEFVSVEQRQLLALSLGVANDTRGGHSWGALVNLRDVHKGLGDIEPVALDLGSHVSVAAHTRWATHGSRTVENAHPFTMRGRTGTVIGAHNGVIYNHGSLNSKFQRHFAVDSMHIFQNIADGMSIDDLEGYGTVWWLMDGEMHLCQMNDAGEIAVAGIRNPTSNEVCGVVFSSSSAHLTRALRDADLSSLAVTYRVDPGAVYVVSNELYRTKMTLSLERGTSRLSWSDYSGFGQDDPSLDYLDTPLDEDKVYEFDDSGNLVSVYSVGADVPWNLHSSSGDTATYCVVVETEEAESAVLAAIDESASLDEIMDIAESFESQCFYSGRYSMRA